MTEEYRVFTVKDGKMIELNYEKFRKRLIDDALLQMRDKLRDFSDNLTHLIEGDLEKLESEDSFPVISMVEEAEIWIKRHESFKTKDVVNYMLSKFSSFKKRKSVAQAAYNAIYGLYRKKKVMRKEDGSYINLEYEEKEESMETLDDATAPATNDY